MRKVFVGLLLVLVLASGARAEGVNLSTPQDAVISWFSALLNGEGETLRDTFTTYGDLGNAYKGLFTADALRGVKLASMDIARSSPVPIQRLIDIMILFKDDFQVDYLAETFARVVPKGMGDSMGVSVFLVKETDEWRVALVANGDSLYFDPYHPPF